MVHLLHRLYGVDASASI